MELFGTRMPTSRRFQTWQFSAGSLANLWTTASLCFAGGGRQEASVRPKAKRTCPCETVWSLFTCILAPIPATVAWLFAQSGWGFNGGRRSSKPMVTPPLGSSFQARSVIKSPASGVSSYSLVLPHGFWSFGEMLEWSREPSAGLVWGLR